MRDGYDGATGQTQQYRLYFLDGRGRIESTPYEFDASGDATAIAMAEGWREGRRMELWCGARRIQIWG